MLAILSSVATWNSVRWRSEYESDGLDDVTEVGDDCQKAQKEAIEDVAHCGLHVGDAVLPTNPQNMRLTAIRSHPKDLKQLLLGQ